MMWDRVEEEEDRWMALAEAYVDAHASFSAK
jgi:hypothetical protein